MKNKSVLVMWLLVLGLLLFSCQQRDTSEERARRAEKSTGDIKIAAVGSWSHEHSESKALNGIEMAVEEINKTGGVLRGRKFHLIKIDDKGTIDGSLLAAEEISKNPDIVAAIGHTFSFTTMPCAEVYAAKGLLLVSPVARNPELLERNNKLIIDVQVKSDLAAKYLAEFAEGRKYKKIVICYVNDDYGTRFATEFEKAAAAYGIKVIDSVPYWMEDMDSFDSLGTKWKNFEFDALLYAGHHQVLGNFIAKMRRDGIQQPILTDSDFTPASITKSEGHLNNLVTTLYFDPEPEGRMSKEFIRAYQDRYGISPNHYAANGYEALKLLADGMKKAGSAAPAKVAPALRDIRDWPGLSGSYSIGKDGGIVGKPVYLVEFRDGKAIKLNVKKN
ncbi:MAG: ABC transporter substrate-binding protein [Syntrophus sp. (in: bacteria)]